MKPTTKGSSNHNNSKVNQEKQEERETWLKLVVKIISWQDGLIAGGSVKVADKITPKEWETYFQRMIKTNTTYDKQKVLSKLQETQESIRRNGGFERKKTSKTN